MEGYHNSLFLGPTEHRWGTLSWTLSVICAKNIAQGCQICFPRVQSMYSGKMIRTVPERPPDVERKVFSRVVKTAFCSESSLTIREKCFSEFAWIILALCEQNFFNQSCQNFIPRGRRNILVMFFRYEQRFFGFRAKSSRNTFQIFFWRVQGNFLRNKLLDLEGKMFSSFQ